MINLGMQNKFSALKQYGKNAKGTIYIAGISESRSAAVAGLLSQERGSSGLIITEDQTKAVRMAEDLGNFTESKIYLLPQEADVYMTYDAKSQENLIEKLKGLAALARSEKCILVGSCHSFKKKLPSKKVFSKSILNLKVGDMLDLLVLKSLLSNMGYERMDQVDARGQFVIRGGIIDIFSPEHKHPVRIELFDVEIDSIRIFDENSQRSIENIEETSICPSKLFLQTEENLSEIIERIKAANFSDEEKASLIENLETGVNVQLLDEHIDLLYPDSEQYWDYLPDDGFVVIDDPDRLAENIEIDREIATFAFLPFLKTLTGMGKLEGGYSLTSKQAMAFNGRMDFFEEEIRKLLKLDYRIIVTSSSQEKFDNMKEFLARSQAFEKVELHLGNLSSGMEFPEEKLSIISDKDIFLRIKKKRYKKEEDKGKRAIKAFADIKKGDYVVHENHGIGKFIGVVQLEVDGLKKDYIKIDYAGEDVLYIPVDQMELIQKYMGADGLKPKINKLTGGEWERIKSRAKAAVQDVAKELLALSAARNLEKGYAFSEDSPWQREFEDLFPFEETEDQLRSIREIKRDMEKPIPMDRLLCGDVGYGKTEVAARAIFKCLTDGKQAAVLVPTTLLASQHYHTFLERFETFPIKVEMLSRFRSDKDQEKIIEKLKKGEIDLLVGTHRLLSQDIKFKDLGLLVIDEEQRFGVQHKETIKKLRKNVDVLAISATPIPRTLHMSLVGIRDMSLIEDPPQDRYPVQTYVLEQDDKILKEIIEKEISRGGQVFVVFNRIRGIYRIATQIEELVPEAKIAVSHGRMDEKIMEDNMLKFVNNQVNVLVSTTIVESGLDIPNANTIVILDADRFGLSQLYQLRGRVGRSNRMAYAYLMYQKDKVLTELAAKRLRAIKEFTEFGSGFHIAMRDLELRGAGNLLGIEQHGHMLMIGYELYIKLVEEAMKELGGVELEHKEEIDISVELPVEAYISSTYIGDESTKFQMYKRIAGVDSLEDKSDIIDEFTDRFGDIPKETLNLIDIALIRSLAGKVGIKRVRTELGKLVLDFEGNRGLNPKIMGELFLEYGDELFIHGGKQAFLRIDSRPASNLKDALKLLTKLSMPSII